jgi:hypothetical protein
MIGCISLSPLAKFLVSVVYILGSKEKTIGVFYGRLFALCRDAGFGDRAKTMSRFFVRVNVCQDFCIMKTF